MRRLWHLLVLLGLAAASLHAPAMALPDPPAPAVAHHADCHGDPAATPDEPACCPDGCFGGCLLPAAMMPPREVAAPFPARAARALPGSDPPAETGSGGLFHPPRAFA